MKHDLLRMLFLIMACISVGAYAQSSQGSYSVKGILVDSLTNEGEPYATIRIVSAQNPLKPVRMAVTGLSGKFNEKLPNAGKYIITFSSVGKNSVQKDFTLSESVKTVDLGTILITEATEMLKGVEVVAQKPLVKSNRGYDNALQHGCVCRSMRAICFRKSFSKPA